MDDGAAKSEITDAAPAQRETVTVKAEDVGTLDVGTLFEQPTNAIEPAPTAEEIADEVAAAEKRALEDRLTAAEEARVSAALAIGAEQEKAKAEAEKRAIATEGVENLNLKPRPFIPPSVSRFVWYRHRRDDGIPNREDHPLSAQICGVIDDETVNIAVMGFDASGPYALQNVRLVQDECQPGECMWMWYQKGQAAKVDALKAKLEEIAARGSLRGIER